MTTESGDDQGLQRALERVWARVSASNDANPSGTESTNLESGNPQASIPSNYVGHVESERTKIRLAFGFFVLIVGIFVFLFGMMRHGTDVTEGTIIMLLSAVPLLGGTWHVHLALKQMKERAEKLEDDIRSALANGANDNGGEERPQ